MSLVNIINPWGRRRNATNWTYNNVPTTFLFDRGYTGHEHLDKFNLINMNGRVYDPWLGRFLSPDPFVQAPGNSQNYNRYSYALNKPLKYTDPSGYTYKPDDWNGHIHITSTFGPGYIGGIIDWSNADAYFYTKSMTYNWETGKYEDMYGNTVSRETAVGISLAGYGGSLYSFSGASAGALYENLVAGFNLYEVHAFGKTTIVSSFGDIGEISYGANGGIAFKNNKTAAAYAGEVSVIGSSGGELADDRFSNFEKATLGLAATGGSVHVTTELINRLSGAVKNADIVNFGKSVTKKFGFVGVGLTIYSVSSDGTLSAGDGARILLSSATFIPYVGWAYGAADIGVLMVTGTSFTDRVGVFIDEHWGPGPIRP